MRRHSPGMNHPPMVVVTCCDRLTAARPPTIPARSYGGGGGGVGVGNDFLRGGGGDGVGVGGGGGGSGAGGRVDGLHCEVTEEDEMQVRVLTQRLALDSGGEVSSSSQPLTFVKMEHPAEVAVIVPHTLHFGEVEHLDYTALVDGSNNRLSRLAVQASESPMAGHRPPSTSSLNDLVNNNVGGGGG